MNADGALFICRLAHDFNNYTSKSMTQEEERPCQGGLFYSEGVITQRDVRQLFINI
jgi:hypothetical protein